MSPILRPLAVVPVLLLAACAAPGQRSATGPVDDAAVNRIGSEVTQAAADFDAALARYRAGDPEAALAAMAEARDRVQRAAGNCARTAGCDLSRIVAAQDALLERQTEELLAPSAEDRPGALEDAPRVVGEGAARRARVRWPRRCRSRRGRCSCSTVAACATRSR